MYITTPFDLVKTLSSAMPLRKPGDIEQFELKPMPSENTAEKDSKQTGLWHRFRRSSALIIGVVFVALGLEVSLSTALDAILPCMLLESDTGEDCRTIQAGQTNFSLPTIDYTGEGGFVIGTKSIVEVFAKPLFGILIDRVGHRWPLLLGSIINIAATLAFAFLNGFPMLMLSRAMQGVGCSLTTVAAIAMLAEAYTDVDERSRAMAKAFGGYAFGVIFGFPLGTFTYQFLGKEFPFLILAGINVLDAVFRLIIVVPEKLVEPSSYGAWSDFKELLVDPYIELGLGYTLMYTLSLGASLAIAPPWIMEEQFGMVWEIGAVFLIAGTLQFIIQFILGHITRKECWWIFAAVGLLLNGLAYIWYPFTSSVWVNIGPQSLIYIGFGFANTVIAPIMGDLVEIRHRAEYGQVYGLTSGAYSLGFITGTVGAGVLVDVTSFNWVCRGIPVLMILYTCICILFRNPKGTNLDTEDPETLKLVGSENTDKYGAQKSHDIPMSNE